MHIRGPAALFLALCLWLPPLAHAQPDFPKNWPWHGVVMSSMTPPAPTLAELRQELGLNFVALQIKPRLRAQRNNLSPKDALEYELTWADQVLDECRAQDVTAMIVCYDFPIDPALGFDQQSPGFWDDPHQVGDMLRAAGLIAKHFRTRGPELAGYQILSEPIVHRDGKIMLPNAWGNILNRIIRSIRRQDPDRWIAASLTIGGSPGYQGQRPLDHARIVYDAHMYLPHNFTHQGIGARTARPAYPGLIGVRQWNRNAIAQDLSSLAEFGRTYKVPVWIGEFSAARWAEGAEQYLKDLCREFNSAKFGWSYFAVSGYHGWHPDYSTQYPEGGDAWTSQYVGRGSVRWQTLREIFRESTTAPSDKAP